MSALPLRDYPTIVSEAAAIAQQYSPQLTDLTDGSPLLALLRASAYNTTYLQYLITLVLKQNRLKTSVGTDVDTYVGDFGMLRRSGQSASGQVTFSRMTTTQTATLELGTLVKTADNNRTFQVIVDLSNPAWNPTINAYFIDVGASTLTVPVQDLDTGTGGNVLANTITQIASSIAFSSVTNPAGFINGLDAESDEALKARFSLFINTRSLATLSAVNYAIQSVQAGLRWSIVENFYVDNTPKRGFFTVWVDDGSGEISADLITAIADAIYPVRPITVEYAVRAADVVTCIVSLAISAAPGYVKSDLQVQVTAAITNYINGLDVATNLSFYALAQVAQSIAGVSQIENLELNGSNEDVHAAINETLRAGTVTVS